jgi:hypothetical protein
LDKIVKLAGIFATGLVLFQRLLELSQFIFFATGSYLTCLILKDISGLNETGKKYCLETIF